MDKSTEILIGNLITPPEMDNDQIDEDRRQLRAIYESTSYALIEESMNTRDFFYVYGVLKNDILDRSIDLKRIFIGKYLDRMEEVYEFAFGTTPIYDTKREIEEMFKFIEFVEYDNVKFLSYVWSYLDGIITVDINKYVRENSKIVIDEITNQVNLMVTVNENISEFLRTYDKEGLMNWFIDRSERSEYDIYANNI